MQVDEVLTWIVEDKGTGFLRFVMTLSAQLDDSNVRVLVGGPSVTVSECRGDCGRE